MEVTILSILRSVRKKHSITCATVCRPEATHRSHHPQEEGVTRGVNTRRWGFTGVIRSLSTPGPSGIQIPPAGNMHLPPLAFSTVSSHWKSGISSSEAKCGCGSSGSSRSPTTGAQFLAPRNLWDCCDQSPASAPNTASGGQAPDGG